MFLGTSYPNAFYFAGRIYFNEKHSCKNFCCEPLCWNDVLHLKNRFTQSSQETDMEAAKAFWKVILDNKCRYTKIAIPNQYWIAVFIKMEVSIMI
jgi:hypothetical protein